jgi:hypothetical protein
VDDDQVVRLLSGLGRHVPQPSVDLTRAMVEGRTRVRHHRYATAGMVALIATLIASAPVLLSARSGPGQPQPLGSSVASEIPQPVPSGCQARLLPPPAGATDSSVKAADRTGRYLVGSATNPDGSQASVLWQDGTLATPNLPSSAVAVAVNSAGTLVGRSTVGSPGSSTESGIWVYTAGHLSQLPRIADDHGARYYVSGINDRGDVVGIAFASAGTPVLTLVVWPATNPNQYHILSPPPGTRFIPPATERFADILDDGTVVAAVTQPGTNPNADRPAMDAYAWNADGSARPLGLPAGAAAYGFAATDSWYAARLPTDPHAVSRFELTTGTSTRYPDMLIATAVNRSGWLVGDTTDGHPVAVLGTRSVPLDPPAGSSAGPGTVPMTISDDGTVIGGTIDLSGTTRALRWLCH